MLLPAAEDSAESFFATMKTSLSRDVSPIGAAASGFAGFPERVCEGARDDPFTLKQKAEGLAAQTVKNLKRSTFDQKWIQMNINGIGSSALSALSSATSSTQTTKTKSSIPPAAGAAAKSNISKPAELLQKLQQLQQQDPAQFKEVLTQLSDSLQKAAAQSSDSNSPIAKLAAAFKTAADTGDLSTVQAAMKPPAQSPTAMSGGAQGAQGPSGHRHGHHHRGGGALVSAFSTALSQIDAALQGSNTTAAQTSATAAPVTTGG